MLMHTAPFVLKGFNKLVCIKEAFPGTTEVEISVGMYEFFLQYDQKPDPEESTVLFKACLCGLFDQFDSSKNPLPKCLQSMFMICGLRGDYSDLLMEYHRGNCKFQETNLKDTTR